LAPGQKSRHVSKNLGGAIGKISGAKTFGIGLGLILKIIASLVILSLLLRLLVFPGIGFSD
jgi:hypothetical protein